MTSPPTERRRLSRTAWVLIVLGLLIVLVVAGLLSFNYGAERKLNYAIGKYRQAGEPILPEDFKLATIPDELNAAIPLRRALLAASIDPADHKALNLLHPTHLPLSEEEAEILARIVQSNRAVLDDIQLARKRPQMAWAIPFDPMQPFINIPEQQSLRQAANVLQYAALLAHQQGRHDESLARVGELIWLSDAALDLNPSMVNHLICIGIAAMGERCAVEISPDLRVNGGNGAASREDAKALIAELLDDRAMKRGWISGLTGARASALVHGRSFASKPLIGPFLKLDLIRTLEIWTSYREAGLKPNYPEARSASERAKQAAEKLWPIGRLTVSGADRLPLVRFRHLTERRMAAIALAIRLYRIDHNDAWPTDLKQLVPDYLPALPGDPFAADDRPLGYVGSGATPMVYSVADNGTDEGASTQPTGRRLSSLSDFNMWERQDAVQYLLRQPKPPPVGQE